MEGAGDFFDEDDVDLYASSSDYEPDYDDEEYGGYDDCMCPCCGTVESHASPSNASTTADKSLAEVVEAYFVDFPGDAPLKLLSPGYASLIRSMTRRYDLAEADAPALKKEIGKYASANPQQCRHADKSVVTRQLLALIISKDAAERKLQQVHEIAQSGEELRLSLSQGSCPNASPSPQQQQPAPHFSLVSRRMVKQIARRYVDVDGLSLAPDVFMSRANVRQPAYAFNSLASILAKIRQTFVLAEVVMAFAAAEKDISDVEVVLAGGSVAHFFAKSYGYSGDLDFFFVSPSGDTAAASNLMDRILKACFGDHMDPFDRNLFFRSETSTTVILAEMEQQIQFIHRLYPSAAAVIGGFDLGYSAVMIHGYFTELSFTHLGAWCHALGVNIVDTTRRSASFEHRLRKYAVRGVHTIFPGIDPRSALQQMDKGIVLMGFLRLRQTANGIASTWQVKEEHDYDSWDTSWYPEVYVSTQNWYYMIRGDVSRMCIYSYQPDFADGVIFGNPVEYYASKVHRFNPRMEGSMLEYYKTVMGEHAKAYVLAELDGDRASMDKIRSELCAKAMQLASAHEQKLKEQVIWRTENPGAQWTASFNPVFEDPRKFYRDLYQPFHVVVTDEVYVNIALLRCHSPLWRMIPRDVLIMIARMTVMLQYDSLLDEMCSAADSRATEREKVYQMALKTISRWREEGNRLLTESDEKDYELASKKYSEAILFIRTLPPGVRRRQQISDLLVACYLNRSLCERHLKQFNVALEDARSATVLDPSKPKGYLRAAQVLFEMMSYDLCLEVCNGPLKLTDPTDTTGWKALKARADLAQRQEVAAEAKLFKNMLAGGQN